jgi:hypothetical protein
METLVTAGFQIHGSKQKSIFRKTSGLFAEKTFQKESSKLYQVTNSSFKKDKVI